MALHFVASTHLTIDLRFNPITPPSGHALHCFNRRKPGLCLGRTKNLSSNCFVFRAANPSFDPSTTQIDQTPYRRREPVAGTIDDHLSGYKQLQYNEDDFVEVGSICGTHGVHGELKVSSLTDFPEERFEKPGIRWVQSRQVGKLSIRQVELVKGRSNHGKQQSWLVTLKGIDTPEKGAELVGATLLVKALERPTLKDDEFYIPDLVGMAVLLQSSGKLVGEVVDVFNAGASDLLRVRLSSDQTMINVGEEKRNGGTNSFVWIPFVKDIVPTVDRNERIVKITPPEGLLELNMKSEGVSKKDSRKQAFKEKRKSREKIAGIKKRVLALKQGHILSGLSSGDKDQRESLANQLMGIDFKLFEHALKDSLKTAKRHNKYDIEVPDLLLPKVDWKGLEEWFNDSARELNVSCKMDKNTWLWWRAGLQLVAEGRVAVIALTCQETPENDPDLSSFKSKLYCQAQQLLFIQKLAASSFWKGEPQIPWIMVTADDSEEPLKSLFQKEDFFGLKTSQVQFLRLSSLPYVSSHADKDCHDILMESPWKIAMGSCGEGHIFNDLSSSGMLENLLRMGVDYVQIHATDDAMVRAPDPLFFGFTHKKEANIGMRIANAPQLDGPGILCLQQMESYIETISSISKGSISRDKHKTAQDNDSSFLSDSKCYTILKAEELPTEVLSRFQDNEKMCSACITNYKPKIEAKSLPMQRVFYSAASSSNNVYSVDYLNYLADQRYRLNYHAVLKELPNMKQVDGQWMPVILNESNALQLKCSIHSSLHFCDPAKVALLEVNP